jgi:hypothetical protein
MSLRSLLPATATPHANLRYAVALSCLVFVALAAQLGFAFAEMREPIQPMLAALLCIEAFFLWLMRVRALIIARWLWGVIIVLLVFGGLVNPFFWRDLQRSGQWWLPVIYLVLCVVGAWCWNTIRCHSPSSVHLRRT